MDQIRGLVNPLGSLVKFSIGNIDAQRIYSSPELENSQNKVISKVTDKFR